MTDASHGGFDHPPAGWQAMVNEVQARIDAVDTALANLRVALSGLTLVASHQEPHTATHEVAMPAAGWSSTMPETSEPAQPEAEAPAFDDESAREEVRRAVEQARNEMGAGGTVSSNGWTMPRDVWPGWSSPHTADDEPAPDPGRDEVRRAVEEAKAELASG